MTAAVDIPRIVIAAASSGAGKTTATVGLCRALRARGLEVAVFKCGPDYLDPTYHERAAGRPIHNLDGWMMGRGAAVATFVRASAGADIAIIEGVMGLFDGASPTGEEGSTAEMAKWLGAPVILVVDASGMARSLAALVGGFAAFDRDLRVAGVICNRIGSGAHLDLLRKAQRTPPIVGGIAKSPSLAFPERHLGLRTADRETVPDTLLDAWGAAVAEGVDFDAVLAIARAAPALTWEGEGGGPHPSPSQTLPRRAPAGEARLRPTRLAAPDAEAAPKKSPQRCRIGLAFDEAFHFYYEHNLRVLESLGAQIVRFSPLVDRTLPEIDGLYLGGGYPEVHARALSANADMREAIAGFAAAGRPIYAECGGLMYLSRAIRTRNGSTHPMVGVLPGEAVMSERLEALGYVEVETQTPTPLGPAGLRFRGHQFRYSRLEGAETAVGAYTIRRRRGGEAATEGYRVGSVLGSYVHAHWASNLLVPEGFIARCASHERGR